MSVHLDPGGKEVKKEPVDMDADREREDSSTRWSEELRLVLIGRTGSGKSASGNTILGRRHFLSRISASSVTQICQLGSTELAEEEDGEEEGTQVVTRKRMRKVTVVDMPGFGDTHLSKEQIHVEVAKCVSLSAPGPHAFLLAVPIGRYTDSENQAACELTRIFGEDAVHHHTLVLFTRGDELEGIEIEEYLRETAPAGLKALIDRCGGRYHVLNNKDPSNSTQAKELFRKIDMMLMQTNRPFYTNAMFVEAEVAIREEQNRMMRERGQADGEEKGEIIGSMAEGPRLTKRRKCDLESHGEESSDGAALGGSWSELEGGNEYDFRVEESKGSPFKLLRERCRDRFRGRRRDDSRAMSRRVSLRSSLTRMRREAALSAKVLERVKVLVAAGATGMAVGAVLGAAAPLAAAAGASLVGNSVGFAASQLAGLSVAGGTGVGKAVGAVVAAASGKTAVALGAATGGVLGGSVGAIAAAEAASPREGALDALGEVSVIGVTVVGAAAGVGGALGAGAALGAALEGAVLGTEALCGAQSAAVGATGVANVSVAQGSLASAAVASAGSVIAGTGAPPAAVAGASLTQEIVAAAPVAAGSLCGLTGPAVTSVASRASNPWGAVEATTRIMSAVAEIGKVAAGIALAGGLVVKVVREKVRCATGTTEKNSYEVYWNKTG